MHGKADPWLLIMTPDQLAFQDRKQRLLSYEVGRRKSGAPVTVEAMLAELSCDPPSTAAWLLRVRPLTALAELAELLRQFRIDGKACPDPHALAAAALRTSGRTMPEDEDHPLISPGPWFARRVNTLMRRFFDHAGKT